MGFAASTLSTVVILLLGQEAPQDGRLFVQGFMRQLNDPDPQKRRDAAIELGKIGSALHAPAMRLQMLVNRDPDPEVRKQAAMAIADIGPSARLLKGQLVKGLDDKDEQVVIAVIRALAATAPFSKEALPKLIELSQSKNLAIRRRVIASLGAFKESKIVIPVLIAALHDADPGGPNKELSVSKLALLVLGDFGEEAYAATDALVKLQQSDNIETRAYALGALVKILPKDAKMVPYYIDLLKSEHKSLRRGAAYALGFLGPVAKDAVPALIKALKATEDEKDQALAIQNKLGFIYSLRQIGPDAKDSIPAIQFVINNTTNELLIAEGRDAILRIEGKK